MRDAVPGGGEGRDRWGCGRAADDRSTDHLEAIAPLVEDGHVLVGGAILNEADEMIGSMLLVDFADRAALDAWLDADPYVTGRVWQEIEVSPFRAAVGAWQPSPA